MIKDFLVWYVYRWSFYISDREEGGFYGIDQAVSQPVTMVYGRYLNEKDILAQRKNVVMEAGSPKKLLSPG